MHNDRENLEKIRDELSTQSKKGLCSWKGALIIILSLAYLASPIDLIPDFLPVIGQADDLGVIIFDILYIIREYRRSKTN
ncbi:MAG: YkvA family protein [Akkermansia sp.]|nr:YkvA family protein [Akkermansia sp.]